MRSPEKNILFFLLTLTHLVKGNELADMNAKKASELAEIIVSIKYSKSEIKSIVKSKSKEKWQVAWNSAEGIILSKGMLKVPESHIDPLMKNTLISRMRFGHTSLIVLWF